MRWIPIGGTIALGALAWPSPAMAHLVTTGLGPFYDGLTHLWLTPEDLLPALALAFLAGLRGRAHGRAVLFVTPVGWWVGGMIAMLAGLSIPFLWATASLFVLGGLVVADARLSVSATRTLAGAIGAFHGILDGGDLAALGLGPSSLLGISLSVFVLLAMTSALLIATERPWTRIAVRAAGSWIVAVGTAADRLDVPGRSLAQATASSGTTSSGPAADPVTWDTRPSPSRT